MTYLLIWFGCGAFFALVAAYNADHNPLCKAALKRLRVQFTTMKAEWEPGAWGLLSFQSLVVAAYVVYVIMGPLGIVLIAYSTLNPPRT